MPWACLQFMIVVFPDHTHLLYYYYNRNEKKSLHCNGVTRGSPQTMLVLTNIYNNMGIRMNQFMTKMMSTSCCPHYCSQFWMVLHTIKVRKRGKDQESIELSTTPDPGYQWESDNVTIRHHKREPIGQPFPSR